MKFERIIKLKNPHMFGEDIKKIQIELTKKNFNCGSIDGYYGKNTIHAVKEFQAKNNLDVDGIVGPLTCAKLFSNINNTNKKEKIICIDVGHGGKDSGASFEGIKEKDIVLDISLDMKMLLEAKGIKVIITRTSDISLDENTRMNIINKSGADVIISNHLNSGGGDGCEVFHSISNNKGKDLASNISKSISDSLKIKNRGPKTKINNNGEDYYFIIIRSKMTALIIEYLFIDKESNLQLLKNNYKHTIRKLAASVVNCLT